MAIWYQDAPEVKYPNLFFEVSNILRFNVEKYKIEHTKAELIFLRDKVFNSLKNEGINQENYKEDSYFYTLTGIVINEIDNFYKTGLSKYL